MFQEMSFSAHLVQSVEYEKLNPTVVGSSLGMSALPFFPLGSMQVPIA